MKTPATIASTPLLERLRQSGRVEEFIQAATTQARVRARRRRRVRHAAVAVLAVAAFLGWAVPYYRSTDTLTTVAAQRTSVVLADGSQAELNANTELFADFRYGRRTIVLRRGEAFFSVAADTAHPFLVRTAAGTVRVTGTKFNVRTADASAEVTLLEGRVAFERDERVTPLLPGQQLEAATATVRDLAPEDLASLTAWRTGQLALKGLSLSEVVQRLAAYHGCQIDCAPEVAGLWPGGSFALDDFAGFIEAMETTLPVRVLHRGDRRYTVVPR